MRGYRHDKFLKIGRDVHDNLPAEELEEEPGEEFHVLKIEQGAPNRISTKYISPKYREGGVKPFLPFNVQFPV
jgi:hypothetical protein